MSNSSHLSNAPILHSLHIEHCTLKGLRLSTLVQQMQCYMANFWLQLISPFSCTNIAHSAYCTHSIYSAISWRFPNGFRLSALAEISLQFRFCMANVWHESHCSQFGISRGYWIATNTCTVPHLKRRNKVDFWQTIDMHPNQASYINTCWLHWGCFSHRQKGARARWQLVYQIYLPAIDTIVTGLLTLAKH